MDNTKSGQKEKYVPVDGCVCCGAAVPEGRMVCPICEVSDSTSEAAEYIIGICNYQGVEIQIISYPSKRNDQAKYLARSVQYPDLEEYGNTCVDAFRKFKNRLKEGEKDNEKR